MKDDRVMEIKRCTQPPTSAPGPPANARPHAVLMQMWPLGVRGRWRPQRVKRLRSALRQSAGRLSLALEMITATLLLCLQPITGP